MDWCRSGKGRGMHAPQVVPLACPLAYMLLDRAHASFLIANTIEGLLGKQARSDPTLFSPCRISTGLLLLLL